MIWSSLSTLFDITSAVLNIWGSYERKKQAEESYNLYQSQIQKSYASLQESLALSLEDLNRWYKQTYAQTFEQEREYVGNVQAYYGARGVELWGSAIQKAMEGINKFDSLRKDLYNRYLLTRRKLITGYENRANSLFYSLEVSNLKKEWAEKQFWLDTASSLSRLSLKYFPR